MKKSWRTLPIISMWVCHIIPCGELSAKHLVMQCNILHLLCADWSRSNDTECKCLFSNVQFSAAQMLIDRRGKTPLTTSWEIRTWLWSSGDCRQCLEVYTARINIREDPARQPVKTMRTTYPSPPPHNCFSYYVSFPLFHLLSFFS